MVDFYHNFKRLIWRLSWALYAKRPRWPELAPSLERSHDFIPRSHFVCGSEIIFLKIIIDVILVLKCTEDSESSVCVALNYTLFHQTPGKARVSQPAALLSGVITVTWISGSRMDIFPRARQICLVFLSRCVHTCCDLKVFHGFKMLKQKPFHFQAMACWTSYAIAVHFIRNTCS